MRMVEELANVNELSKLLSLSESEKTSRGLAYAPAEIAHQPETWLSTFQLFQRYLWISFSRSGNNSEGVAVLDRACNDRPDIHHIVVSFNSRLLAREAGKRFGTAPGCGTSCGRIVTPGRGHCQRMRAKRRSRLT